MRDKFLTEAMGECWHEQDGSSAFCKKCRRQVCGGISWKRDVEDRYNNFSTWAGFGKLWEWS